MKISLGHRAIPYECQKEVTILFQGQSVGTHRFDLVVADEIIVELKAVRSLDDAHFAQVRSYLKASALRVGLLLNFNTPKLAIKRVVL